MLWCSVEYIIQVEVNLFKEVIFNMIISISSVVRLGSWIYCHLVCCFGYVLWILVACLFLVCALVAGISSSI